MTPLAHAVRFAMRCGITKPADLAAELECTQSAIYRAMKQLKDADHTVTTDRMELTEQSNCDRTVKSDQSELTVRSETDCTVTSEPRARTRIETPSGLLPHEDIGLESPPSPSNVQPVTDWRSAFGADDNHGVQFSNGRLTLVNGTRAFWLEQFGGDETALNLALIESAGSIQRGSNAGLKLQVERKLANIARDTRDRDKRYERVAGKNRPQSGAPPVSPMRALLNKSKGQEARV